MKYPYLLLFLTVFGHTSHACTCFNAGNFFEVSRTADVVAKVKVIRFEDYFSYELTEDSIPVTIVAEVLELYKGKLKSTTIRLTGDGSGFTCKEPLEQFKPGHSYFLAYSYKIHEISACGEFYVEINGNNIVNKSDSFFDDSYVKSMTTNKFEKKLLGTINICQNDSFDPKDNIVEKQVSENCTPHQADYIKMLGFILFFIGILLIILVKRKKQN